jgi:hypothetical protein
MDDAASGIEERPLTDVLYVNRRVLPGLVTRRKDRVELFVPAPLDVDAGTSVRLRVTFGDSGKKFYVGGRALVARRGADPADGYLLAITQPAEMRSFRHLWTFCTSLNHEQARRFSTSIPCAVHTRTSSLRGRILDLSMSGAFVSLGEHARELEPGAEIELRVRGGFLRLLRRDIRAQLVWAGAKFGSPGFGAEFVDGARVGLHLVKERVRR